MPSKYSTSLDIGRSIKHDEHRKQKIKEAQRKEPEKPSANDLLNEINKPTWITGKQIWIFLALLIIFSYAYLQSAQNLTTIDTRTRNEINSRIEKDVVVEITQAYPFATEAEKRNLIAQEIKEIKKSPETKAKIDEIAKAMKEYYKDEHDNTYLFGFESSYYLRKSREQGQDNLRNYPQGTNEPTPFISKLLGYSNVFAGLTLERTAFILAILLGVISVIITFFAVKNLFESTTGGFLTAASLALSPLFYITTHGGVLNEKLLMIPGVALTILAVSLMIAKYRITSLLLGILGLLLIQTTGAILPIITGLILSTVYYWTIPKTKSYNKYTDVIMWLLIILTSTLLSLLPIYYSKPKTTFSLFETILLPQTTNLPELITTIGGPFIALITLIGLIWLTISRSKTTAIILGMTIPTLAYVFIHTNEPIYLIPLALAAGYGLLKITNWLTILLAGFDIEMNAQTAKFTLSIIFALIIYLVTFQSIIVYKDYRPVMSDSFAEAGKYLSQTGETSLILTGPTLGYLWQETAQRPTFVDLKTNNSLRNYWLSTALITDNEELTRGIIRMITCGKEQEIFNTLTPKHGSAGTIEQLKKILQIEEKAAKIIANELNPELSNLIYCDNPPETYFIISEDMLASLPTMANTAWRDIELAEIKKLTNEMSTREAIKYLSQQRNITQEQAGQKIIEAQQFLDFTIPYSVSEVAGCEFDGIQAIRCVNGIVYEKEIASLRGAKPAELLIINQTRKKIVYRDSPYNIAILLYNIDGPIFQTVVVDKKLIDTMFLGLFAGEQFKYFENVFTAGKPDRVIIYKVDWNGSPRNTTKPVNPTFAVLDSKRLPRSVPFIN